MDNIIYNLLQDPYGHEALWDYCLEYNIAIPNEFYVYTYYGFNGLSGYRNRGFSYSSGDINLSSLSLSGRRATVIGKRDTEAGGLASMLGSGKRRRPKTVK